MTPEYDSIVARIAGQLLSSAFNEWASNDPARRRVAVEAAVNTARLIIDITQRTEPVTPAAAEPSGAR